MPFDKRPPSAVSSSDDGIADTLRRDAGYGLDALNLAVANIQTGFGPFIVVLLTSEGWTQTAIGVTLSIGTIAAMASQAPAGIVVDAVAQKSLVALVSVIAFAASALLFALWPSPLPVYIAEILHGFSSCTLGPAIAALSLLMAQSSSLGTRLGRNTRFASIGNGIGAALMGACGYYFSERSVFFLTAALVLPTLLSLIPLRRYEKAVISRDLRQKELQVMQKTTHWRTAARLMTDWRLGVFGLCAALFTLGNAALLPLASSALTKNATGAANLFIAACIVLPQFIVALLSPTIGRIADQYGRRVIIILAFGSLTARALLFACFDQPIFVLIVQSLDGVAGACFGVMVPLVTSDLAGRSGHFNLCLGLVGMAIGVGATISTSLGGWISDHFSVGIAYLSFAGVSAIGIALALIAFPETRPDPSAAP